MKKELEEKFEELSKSTGEGVSIAILTDILKIVIADLHSLSLKVQREAKK